MTGGERGERAAPRGRFATAAASSAWLLVLSCGGSPGGEPGETAGRGGVSAGGEAGAGGTAATDTLPYARELVSFEPGEGAGFGEADLPDVVLGPPDGRGELQGGLDVLSLGRAGRIVLGFGEAVIFDGEGPDFIVFENAFWPGGDPTQVFAEPGEVSVSEDGETWLTFDCDAAGDGMGRFPGCAGVTPTLEFDALAMVPLDPGATGGDAFDLAELGLSRVRFVRVTDVSNAGSEPTAGFDLDAIGVVHIE